MSLPNNMLGKRLGNYQILSLLGAGGMATVYRARQLNIERDVAVKVLRPDTHDVENMIKRFAREAQTVATLRHPNILKLFDYGQQEGFVYLVMELMPGGSLADLISRDEPLPLNRIGRFLQQIASALDYAHQHNIIHRDLKSHNVLLDEGGNASLTDFGIAKMIEREDIHAMTQTGVAMGTPAYMAPEQWMGKEVDARTDIYAFGVMAFELFSGQLPFRGETIYAMMHMHVNETPPSIRDLRSDLPPDVETVFRKALAKNPEDRFQSATLMFEAFRTAITRRGTGRLTGSVLQTVVNRIASNTAYNPRDVTVPKEQSLRKGTAPGQRRTDGKSVDQIWVPEGCFTMGSDPKKDKNAQPNEQPAHQVCLSRGYWLDMYPVTQAAFQRFIEDGGYSKRELWSDEGWTWRQSQGDNCPINYENFVHPHHPRVGISWFEAESYARWRGGRLPTEAEWEYAARGPNSTIYPWGDTFDTNNVVVKVETTFQVGLKEVGKSWCSAYDMAGNVYEWVLDWYEFRYYHTSPPEDPPGPSTGKLHVVRGGPESFISARCAFRHFDYPGYRGRFFGFRVLTPAE